MTEADWLSCTALDRLMKAVRDTGSDRKLRLFACACTRRVWDLLQSEETQQAVGLAEAYADGRVAASELRASPAAASIYFRSCSSAESASIVLSRFLASHYDLYNGARDSAQLARVVLAPGGSASVQKRRYAEQKAQCDLLRHIMGNPFRPLASPAHWPEPVVRLAEGVYAGEASAFALHDALLDAGHAELAEHFREGFHPKGCWATDLILGKK